MTPSSRALDTSPELEALRFDLYRRMTPEQKARRVSDLTLGACQLAITGLKQRYPKAGAAELLLRLAVLRLGAETVARAYGWVAPRDGP
jgi:hypothetical protein